jgi:hypothetical protein
MRWIGEGILEKKNHMIFFSCHKKNHMFGTGFIINKKIKHLVMDFKAKSHTMCRLRIRRPFLTIVLCTCPNRGKEQRGERCIL